MKGKSQEPDYDCTMIDEHVADILAARGDPGHVKPRPVVESGLNQTMIHAVLLCAFVATPTAMLLWWFK